MEVVSRRWLMLVAAACVFGIYLYQLVLPTPLLDPDEGLHASIAQEMVERGDYLVPRFCGVPFRDKPIVFFLAEAASLRMFGMNEVAVRLPGEAFVLLGCLTTALLAWRLFDEEVAWYALVAALTMVLPIMLSLSPAPDVALLPAINLLALCFWEEQLAHDRRTRYAWLAGGAVAFGVALLTKGLIGIAVFSVGVAMYVALTQSYSWRLVVSCLVVAAIGSALAAPWFLVMEQASPGYLKYYFVDRHLLGYVTEGQFHGEAPWYYYAAPVLGGSMPWLLYAIARVAQLRFDAWRSRESRGTVFLACWFVGGLCFLTFANSKLLTYALPLFPPVAILGGAAFARFFGESLAPAIRWAVTQTFRLACAFGAIGVFVTLLVFDEFLNAPSVTGAYVGAIIAGVVIAAALVIFERGNRRLAFAVGILWFPLSFVALINGPFQMFAELHSQQTLAEELTAREPLPDKVVMIGEQAGSVMFYLSPEEREWFRAGRLGNAFRTELDQLSNLPPNSVVVIEDKELGRTQWVDEVQLIDPTVSGRFHLFDSEMLRVAEAAEAGASGQK
ncbi:MAG: glycosyltransferase family 39 protein [Pirellulales bacterium]